MKKLIILIVSLVVLGGLGWYLSTLFANKGKSDTELIEFAIKDIETVDKVIITDKFSQSFELQKKDGQWVSKEGTCLTQENVGFILDAIKNIEFKGYLPDNSHAHYIKMMTAQHIKVEIFQNGEWTKTWYLGPPAQDHYGQIMLLDSKDFGKSDIPVLMKIKGINGIIEPRFFADPRQWACTNVFSLSSEEIAEVEIRNNVEPQRSFKVTKNGADMKVYQMGTQLQNVDNAMIYRYLNNYNKIHYNLQNFELTQAQVDSVKRSTPFATIRVKQTNGKQTKLRCFYLQKKEEAFVGENKIRNADEDKFWCALPTGELVKCQFFVFNPLLLGHIYFPMDVGMLEDEPNLIPQ